MDQQARELRIDASDKKNITVSTSRRRSLVGTLLALLALFALGWLAWHLTHQSGRNGSTTFRRAPPATTVGVATAAKAAIPVLLDALGTVNSPATATVRPQVSGVLQKVLFHEGQRVKAGQLLAQIDPRQFEMALMQASGQRQRDEAQLDNARILLERDRTLLAEDSIARQDVDTQEALVKQLQGTVITDRAAEGMARLNLGYSRVAAPISGRVGLRVVDIGNVVNPSDVNGIAVITQLSPIDVEFAVPEDRAQELRARLNENAVLPVTAFDRTRTQVLDTGTFLALDNQVDTQTGTVKAKARFTNPEASLFPSQFVNVQLLMRTIKDAVVVPVTAVRHGGNGDFVYVLNKEKRTVSLRPVKRGEATVDQVQIMSGVTAGEQVITEGADRLKDGDHVMLPGDKPMMPGAPGAHRRGQAPGAADATNPANPDTKRHHRQPSEVSGQ